MTHQLVVIGHLGIKRAYLDVPLAAAVARFMRDEREPEGARDWLTVEAKVIVFDDEFGAYDCWKLEEPGRRQ